MIRGEDQEDAKVLGHQYEVTVEPYSQSREKQLKKKRTKAIFSQGKAGKRQFSYVSSTRCRRQSRKSRSG